jgi:hypothetical protein
MKKEDSFLDLLLMYIEPFNNTNKSISKDKNNRFIKTSNSCSKSNIENSYNKFKLQPIRGLNF